MTDGWWTGGNPWDKNVEEPADYDSIGVDGSVFFFESSTADAVYSFGVVPEDGVLPLEFGA